ncbi:type I restriction endonuclease subunit R, partial [Candidatus Parcubacteria bacterium]
EEKPLKPITGDLREPRDRERTYLQELIERLNEIFGKEVTDEDKVAFAVHVSEKLRNNAVVMAQVRNNPREEALKADLPQEANKAIVEAMTSHSTLAQKLLSDEFSWEAFLAVLYDMLKKDVAGSLVEEVRR